MADGFVVGAVLFCRLILWGRASENDMAADWREESEANTCLKVFGQTLPLGSLLRLPLLKGHHSMTAVGYEVWEEQKGKASRHTTFCISRIVAGTTGQIQRVVCN